MTDLVIENLRGPIVGPVSLTIAAGTCAAITGPSGSGKSLLLRMIADLVPSDGTVRLGDTSRADVPAPSWRRRVTYVAAEAGWWAPHVDAHVPNAHRGAAARVCERLGLSGYLEREVATLSTGEKQRLALMRALVRRPDVLLLDEPTSALDAANIGCIEDILRAALSAGAILIIITHERAQADRLGATRYVMLAGKLTPA